MNKLLLFISLFFIATNLKAQTDKAFSVGAGGGAATTYAGAEVIKTTTAFYGTVAYYPSDYLEVSLEGQFGKLAGGIPNPNTHHLNFVNDYKAGFLEAHEHLGVFFEDADNGFGNLLSNIYVGTGFGLINNNVTQTNKTIDHSHNTIPVIPLKFGYVWSIKTHYGDEIINVDFSYSANATIGRGVDGYYGSMPQAEKFYVFYAVGLEYTFDLSGNFGGKKLKF